MNNAAQRTFDVIDPEVPECDIFIQALLRRRSKLDSDRQKWRALLEKADHQIGAIDYLISSSEEEEEAQIEYASPLSEAVVNPTEACSPVEEPSGDTEPVSGTATAQDIAHCRTQREASHIIAEKNGGTIDLNSAALVIKAAGLSKGMVSTVVSSLHNFMTHSDDWLWTGPSQFELVVGRDAALDAVSMTDTHDEDSSEANIVEGDSIMAQTIDETAA